MIYIFCGGPRSRRYGRTATLGLLVQHYYYYYYYFVLFLVMEHEWNGIDRGRPKCSGKPIECHFAHHKSHVDIRDRTWVSAVGARRLTA
jgi:hypothetical protein